MEIAEIGWLAEKKAEFLQRLSDSYRGTVISTVNKAFGRDYSVDDRLEILSYDRIALGSDCRRTYQFRRTSDERGGELLCITERGYADSCEQALLGPGELVFDMGCVALVRPKDSLFGENRMYCIIDTPGGSVKYAIPSVQIDINSRQIKEIFDF